MGNWLSIKSYFCSLLESNLVISSNGPDKIGKSIKLPIIVSSEDIFP